MFEQPADCPDRHHGEDQGDHESLDHDAGLAVIASIRSARNETPCRSPMSQVAATRPVTRTGVNSAEALGFSGDLDDERVGRSASGCEQRNVEQRLSRRLVDPRCLGVEVDDRLSWSRRGELDRLGVDWQAHDCSLRVAELPLPLGKGSCEGKIAQELCDSPRSISHTRHRRHTRQE